MIDDAIERWGPHSRPAYVQLLYHGSAVARSLATAAVALITVLLLGREIVPVYVLAMVVGPVVLLMLAAVLKSTARSPHLSADVRFELCPQSVRTVTPFGTRELSLAAIDRVEVVHLFRRAGIGHVVIRSRGEPGELEPVIPTGRRVSAGTTGLVTWASVEHVDPAGQLMEGPLTFWFVAQPDEVAMRLRAAVEGVAPHARGPHR